MWPRRSLFCCSWEGHSSMVVKKVTLLLWLRRPLFYDSWDFCCSSFNHQSWLDFSPIIDWDLTHWRLKLRPNVIAYCRLELCPIIYCRLEPCPKLMAHRRLEPCPKLIAHHRLEPCPLSVTHRSLEPCPLCITHCKLESRLTQVPSVELLPSGDIEHIRPS